MNPGSVPQPRRAVKGALVVAHHAADHYDRCFRIPLPGGRFLPVCARCLGLYGTALPLLGLALFAHVSGAWMGVWGLWLLPLPALADALSDWLGLRSSNNLIRVATAIPAGVALAHLLERYLAHPTDPIFWGVAGLYGGVGGIGALIGAFRRLRESLPD